MSREKQIEEIFDDMIKAETRSHEHCLANVCHKCEYYGDGECDNHIRAEFLYEAGYRKQSEWISVDERLPEESGVYVAYTDNGNSMTLDYSAKHKLFNSFDSYSRDVAEGFAIPVTHWVPLPEAPKGGAE